jgi:isoleucyl-tRNA synthetase
MMCVPEASFLFTYIDDVRTRGALWNLHDTDHEYSLDWRLDAPQI